MGFFWCITQEIVFWLCLTTLTSNSGTHSFHISLWEVPNQWLGCVCVCVCVFSSVHVIFQVRILKWVAISYSRGSFWPRDRTLVSFLAGGFFTTKPPGKSLIFCQCLTKAISIEISWNPALLTADTDLITYIPYRFSLNAFGLASPVPTGNRYPRQCVPLN